MSDVKFGGSEKVSDKDPAVRNAIGSSVRIQSHHRNSDETVTTESGNFIDLPESKRKALGLGPNDSVILTDAHGVVDAKGEIMVEGSNDKWYAARLIKLDDVRDLAYLKIDNLPPGTLPSVKIAESDDTQPGDLVYSVGHVGFEDAITVNGGKFTGMTSKKAEMGKLDKIFSAAENKPYNYAGNYQKIVDGLQPGDRYDASTDFNRPLMAADTHNKKGMSGGALFNAKGRLIANLESTEEDPSLGKQARDVYTPLSQVWAFNDSPSKFNFKYSSMLYKNTAQVPSLDEIYRANGDRRLPFSSANLIEGRLSAR